MSSTLPSSLELVLALGLSALLAVYLTPIIRRGALRFGVVDSPDGQLKRHAEPVPYLGGIAIYLTFLLTIALLFDFEPRLLGLLLGGTMVAMLGLFDDLRVLTPELKLIGQLLVVWVSFKSGIFVQLVTLPAWFMVLLTAFWLVGITNGFNIIDVSDGLASVTAAVAAAALAVLAIINQDHLIAITTVVLIGSLVGFLRYNWAPARIYLGDTGSLLLGFVLATSSLASSFTRHNEIAALSPVLILAVPILDTVLVSTARLARGLSPLRGSDDHFALRLKARGLSSGQVAAAAGVVGASFGAAGVALALVTYVAALAIVTCAAVVFFALWLWLYFACPTPSELRSRRPPEHAP